MLYRPFTALSEWASTKKILLCKNFVVVSTCTTLQYLYCSLDGAFYEHRQLSLHLPNKNTKYECHVPIQNTINENRTLHLTPFQLPLYPYIIQYHLSFRQSRLHHNQVPHSLSMSKLPREKFK